ncbi:hypothetical protein X798_01897 [Onchocerca flexuosa]|uniref:G-protein coupled receptors family 1 profile domain-containing protein n=1 Tax=Onchocerca flexuosa TaxID=387005 RepID=A0A238C0U3_9BILA|nr:hypothetical protein X798_01897 [Onchocerca flexuosa]
MEQNEVQNLERLIGRVLEKKVLSNEKEDEKVKTLIMCEYSHDDIIFYYRDILALPMVSSQFQFSFLKKCTTLHALYNPSEDIKRETVVTKRFPMKWVSQIKNHVTRNFFSPKSSFSVSTTSSVEILNSKMPVIQPAGLKIPPVTLIPHGSTSRNENNAKQSFMSSANFRRRSSCESSSFSNLNIKRNNLLHFSFSPITLLQRKRKQTKAERRAHKAFRTITFIVGCFAILWSPYYIAATVYGFCRHCIPSLLYTLTYYMCYLNSSSNPFAYALANRQFRITFLRILRGNFSKNS